MMTSLSEPTDTIKAVLPKLAAAWLFLKEAMRGLPDSEFKKRLLFAIEEGLQFKTIADLPHMLALIVRIYDLTQAQKLPEEINRLIEEIWYRLDDVLPVNH